jgi:hypothetical protein
MIQVISLDVSREAAYSEFVSRQESALIYSTLEYRDFLCNAVDGNAEYLVAVDDDGIAGVMPLFRLSHSEYGSVVNSLPWYGSHGSCLVEKGERGQVARTALLEAYRGVVASSALSSTIVLSPFEQQHLDTYLSIAPPTVTDRRTGQMTPLPLPGPDQAVALEKTILQKTRNLVRKSLRQNFSLEIDDTDSGWRFLYETHVENLAAIGGRAKPREHFEALRRSLPRQWQRLYTARQEGTPVAALLVLDFNRTTEYFTPVVKHEYRPLQPLSFLIWHAMLHSIEKRMKWWNWGGTWPTQRSLYHFKAGWGAVDFPYSYLIQASPEAVSLLKRELSALERAYRNYYLYPYSLLT